MKPTLSLLLLAAAVAAPATASAEATCVWSRNVVTMVDDGPREGTLCFDDTTGRITSWKPGTAPPPAPGLLLAPDGWVTPGFVDVMSELGVVQVSSNPDTSERNGGGDPIRAAFRVVDAIQPLAAPVALARAGGITSAITVPTGGLVSGLGVWWDLDDRSAEPLTAGSGVMVLNLDAEATRTAGGSRGTVLERFREVVADVRAWRANPRAHDEARMRDLSVSRADLEALAPVFQGALPVIVRATSRSDILATLRFVREHNLVRVTIAGATEAWTEAPRLAEAGVLVTYNPLENLPASFDQLLAREDAHAPLNAAGVPYAFTVDDGHRAHTLGQSAGNSIGRGNDRMAAFRAVTTVPARIAGVDADYGTLAPGRIANVVIWDADPLDVFSAPTHVFIRGRAQSLETRQKALLRRHRTLPR